MLSLETKGGTRAQILQGLDLNLKETPKATVCEGLRHLPHGQFLLTARSIAFVDKNGKPVHTFWEDVRKPSRRSSIPFRDSEEAEKRTNQYIEKGTQGKMVDFVKDLDEDTTLVLMNYTFFRGGKAHQKYS